MSTYFPDHVAIKESRILSVGVNVLLEKGEGAEGGRGVAIDPL